MLKVYEMVLLDRCQRTLLKNINKQQGGFQRGLGCIMSSFVLLECLYFGYEQSSKVYTCFLDGKQAFDHVWHTGLFYKLMEYNVDATTLLSIREMYVRVQRVALDVKDWYQQNFPCYRARDKVVKVHHLCTLFSLTDL